MKLDWKQCLKVVLSAAASAGLAALLKWLSGLDIPPPVAVALGTMAGGVMQSPLLPAGTQNSAGGAS
jgi:hypothetical protein